MDNAGNEILISSDGIILDNTKKPTCERCNRAARITIRTEDKNNIYNQDVRLDIFMWKTQQSVHWVYIQVFKRLHVQ